MIEHIFLFLIVSEPCLASAFHSNFDPHCRLEGAIPNCAIRTVLLHLHHRLFPRLHIYHKKHRLSVFVYRFSVFA